jgi:crossover junction endodeoxyribonuclease RuvC
MTRSKKFSQMPNNLQTKNKIILGIDPGYGRIGIAIIKNERGNQTLIHSECFETDGKLPHPERLLLIGEKIKKIIKNYKPDKIVVETLLWSKNKKTAMQVAEARGVILLEAARQKIFIREINPNQIKLAVTGYGKSDKKQVINMVEKLIKLKQKKRHDDEYDAIAIAIACAVISLSTDIRV